MRSANRIRPKQLRCNKAVTTCTSPLSSLVSGQLNLKPYTALHFTPLMAGFEAFRVSAYAYVPDFIQAEARRGQTQTETRPEPGRLYCVQNGRYVILTTESPQSDALPASPSSRRTRQSCCWPQPASDLVLRVTTRRAPSQCQRRPGRPHL